MVFILILLSGEPFETGKNKNKQTTAVISIAQQRNSCANGAINSGALFGFYSIVFGLYSVVFGFIRLYWAK